MRDPERIRVVTRALEECWREFPDMRFGQLIDNILTYCGRKTRTEAWNMEENEWLEAIQKFRKHYVEDNWAKLEKAAGVLSQSKEFIGHLQSAEQNRKFDAEE